MTARQTAESAAYVTFLLLMTEFEALARTVPAFFRYTEALRALMAEVTAVNVATQHSTKGATEDKNQVKARLYDAMTTLVNLVLPYADDIKDTVLVSKLTAFSPTFRRTNQQEITALCRSRLEDVKAHAGNLADYGVTPERLQEAQDLTNNFDDKQPLTLSQTKSKGVSTKTRNQLFDKMDALVNDKILKLAESFKKDNPDFYNRVIATLTVAESQNLSAFLKIRFETATGNKLLTHTLMARAAGEETLHAANSKGEVIMRFPRGGRRDIDILIEGGEPVKRTGVLLKKGKTKLMVIPI